MVGSRKIDDTIRLLRKRLNEFTRVDVTFLARLLPMEQKYLLNSLTIACGSSSFSLKVVVIEFGNLDSELCLDGSKFLKIFHVFLASFLHLANSSA